eukprot:1296282-Pyramimonas_sp.AAC.1
MDEEERRRMRRRRREDEKGGWARMGENGGGEHCEGRGGTRRMMGMMRARGEEGEEDADQGSGEAGDARRKAGLDQTSSA